MKNAEYQGNLSYSQRDSAEHEGYAGAQSVGSQGRNVRVVMQNVKVYIRGWLGYFGIASMKATMQRWDEWLRRRFRSYIWKQWKLPRTRVKNLVKLGMPQWQAYRNGSSRKGYWAIAGSGILARTITNERLVQAGYYSILTGTSLCTYAIEPTCTERYARWCERSARKLASYSIFLLPVPGDTGNCVRIGLS